MALPDYTINVLGGLDPLSLRSNGFAKSMQGAQNYGAQIAPALGGLAKSFGDVQKKSRADELIAEYNNQNSQIFAGMQGGQRARKLGRLLLPHDTALSNQYLKLADSMDEKEAANAADLALLKQKGANDLAIETLKSSMPENIKPADREKAINARANLAQRVLSGAVSKDKAVSDFNRDYPAMQYGVEFPSNIDEEGLRSLAGQVIAPTAEAGFRVGQETVGDKIAQEGIATKQAAANLVPAQYDASQYAMDESGLYHAGIPKPLEGYVDKLSTDYKKVTRELEGNVKDAEFAAEQLAKLTNNFTKNLSGFDAVAAVFRAMKSLDPTSTVRESEYDAARNAGGWFQSAMAAFDRFTKGETLPAEVVKQMANVAVAAVPKYKSSIDSVKAEAADKAAMRKINPSYVMGRDAKDYMSAGKPINTSTIPAGAVEIK